MSKERIVIDVDEYGDWMDREALGVVIICAPTGVMCTAQVGGQSCSHPAIEGYPINLRVALNRDGAEFDNALARFDDCKRGCWLYPREEPDDTLDKYRLEYGTAIDNFLKESINSRGNERIISPDLLFSFDYERLDEVMEGWWPVLIQFKVSSFHGDLSKEKQDYYHNKQFKGYLYLGNCD